MSRCNSVRYALPDKEISIAINHYFKPYNINDPDQYLQKEITEAYSKMVDSLASVHGYLYFPNYRLAQKHKSTFELIGVFGDQHNKAHLDTWFAKGMLLRTRDSLTYFAFSVNDNDSTKLFSSIISSRTPTPLGGDVPNFVVRRSLKMGGVLFSLVPDKNILDPQNGPDSLTSFSIDRYIVARGKEDKKIACILTNIMNNILVFNQQHRDIYFKPKSKIEYNYYPNYRKRSAEKAQYNIGGRLISEGDSCHLILFFRGNNLNLIAPTKIDPVISFNKTDILEGGDYGNIMIHLSQVLNEFTWLQYRNW